MAGPDTNRAASVYSLVFVNVTGLSRFNAMYGTSKHVTAKALSFQNSGKITFITIHAQIALAIIAAFTGALAAPPATYPTAAAANGTVASGPLKPVFLAFSTAAAAKIPGAELLKYCGDPSDYLLKFKNLNVEPLIAKP
ncbi:hypothetical protein LTR56_027048 [Elasticomyces elasticus]|nr:hypothetical protein LTR56_027048 [Elasticomyces elasticus]